MARQEMRLTENRHSFGKFEQKSSGQLETGDESHMPAQEMHAPEVSLFLTVTNRGLLCILPGDIFIYVERLQAHIISISMFSFGFLVFYTGSYRIYRTFVRENKKKSQFTRSFTSGMKTKTKIMHTKRSLITYSNSNF